MLTRKKKIKNLFFLGQKWKLYLEKINISAQNNYPTVHQEKNEIISFNANLKAELSPFFFKPWVKNQRIFLTKRQSSLKKLYKRYKKKLFSKKKERFFENIFWRNT